MQAERQLTVTVGGAVDECRPEALEAWRKQYAPAQSLESALLEECRRIICAATILTGGFMRVVVTVTARRPWQSDSYYYTYRLVGDGEYVRDGKA